MSTKDDELYVVYDANPKNRLRWRGSDAWWTSLWMVKPYTRDEVDAKGWFDQLPNGYFVLLTLEEAEDLERMMNL